MATPPTYSLTQAPTFDMGLLINAVAATTSQNTPDFFAQHFKGITVILNVTNAGTGSIFVSVQGKDSVSNNYWNLIAGSAVNNITTNGTYVYTLYPGINQALPAGTNQALSQASTILPAQFRILVTANNANPMTYTVSAVLTT